MLCRARGWLGHHRGMSFPFAYAPAPHSESKDHEENGNEAAAKQQTITTNPRREQHCRIALAFGALLHLITRAQLVRAETWEGQEYQAVRLESR